MNTDEQPGIRFVGVELLSVEFAVTGEIPKPMPIGLDFTVEKIIAEDKKALNVLVKVDIFRNVDKEEKPPVDFKFAIVGRFEVGGATEHVP